jgi:hypothetical protein
MEIDNTTVNVAIFCTIMAQVVGLLAVLFCGAPSKPSMYGYNSYREESAAYDIAYAAWRAKNTWRRKVAAALTVSLLCSWLVVPWCCYAVSSLYTWNLAKINDLNRPVQVTPPAPVIRPSAAEKTP